MRNSATAAAAAAAFGKGLNLLVSFLFDLFCFRVYVYLYLYSHLTFSVRESPVTLLLIFSPEHPYSRSETPLARLRPNQPAFKEKHHASHAPPR
jgi:hypothetical protein